MVHPEAQSQNRSRPKEDKYPAIASDRINFFTLVHNDNLIIFTGIPFRYESSNFFCSAPKCTHQAKRLLPNKK